MLNPGQRIGPFEIVSLLGRGGMGEVFLATDTRLDRKVAIKILPAEFASDRQRLCRFEQEAKTLAALDHPNILSIFDTGVHDGTAYLVSQFLDGSTLREELKNGGLPQRKAIDYALQIANGLAAAHAKRIIHRDLKPENIFVTKDGRVKILDFGLAKLKEREQGAGDRGQNDAHSGAVTLVQTTEPGMVLGTVGYMSPEQVRGEEADHRSDIFAFGCVLFEMLSGQRAFRKESAVQTMNAILTEETPELMGINPGVSQGLQRIVARCLEKQPQLRFQHSNDLAFALEAFSSFGAVSNTGTSAGPKVRQYIAAGILATLLLGLAHFSGRWESSVAVQESPKSLTLRIPRMKFAINSVVVINPQASHVAYCPNRVGDPIYLRALNGTDVEAIPGTEGADYVFFSPDGSELGFFRNKKLYRMGLANRLPQPICSVAETPVRGASWGDDGYIYFATRFDSVIRRVSHSGGTPEPITRLLDGETGHNHPFALPNGRGLMFTVFTGDSEQVAALAPQAGKHHIIQKNASHPKWTPTGHLMFLRESSLLAARLDLRKLVVDEAAHPIVSGVTYANQPYALSEQLLVYFSEEGNKHQLCWVGADGSDKEIHEFQRAVWEPSISPTDPATILIRYPQRQCQLWLFDSERKQLSPFAAVGDNHTAVWSPDGKQIAFCRLGISHQLILKGTGRDQQEQMVWTNRFLEVATSFSPDGKQLAVTLNTPDRDLDIYVVEIDGNSEPRPFKATPHRERGAMFSPNGNWIAYTSNESGVDEVYVVRATGEENARFVSVGGGTEALWDRSGAKLFYRNGGKLYQVSIQTEPSLALQLPQLLFDSDFEENVIPFARLSYDYDPAGQRFLMLRRTGGRSEELQVKINWAAQLK